LNNKESAIAFLNLASSGNVRKAYEEHVHPDFLHHNPYFKGDRESLLVAMEEAHATNPNQFIHVQRAIGEGDLVAVHSHVRQMNGSDIAVVHIFRFEDRRIIELWDVGMLFPEESPNQNGMF
jgi:predicted SnoaL-like aldol condensation-catalyzing enzyme